MIVEIIAALLVIACTIYILLTPRDVDPDFLVHQAAVSTTQQPQESAVFRSLANEHGRALLGSMKPLSQFRFASLSDEIDSFQILFGPPSGRTPVTITDFKTRVAGFQQAIKQFPAHEEVPFNMAVSVDALAAYFAIVLSGRVPRITNESEPAWQKNYFTSTNQLEVVSTGLDAVYVNDISVSQVDLGVAIAAQLTALGQQHRWTQKDTVLMAPGPLSTYTLVAMLTALSAKAKLVFSEAGPMLNASHLLELVRPSILVADDVALRTLSKQTDDFRLPQWIQYTFRRLRLARGALTQPPMLPEFSTVRLIHSSSGPDPLLWLDSGETTSLRVITGTQIVHVLTPHDGLPITQTAVGDYRPAAPKSKTGTATVCWGPPLPGLELKKRGDQLYVQRANHAKWVHVDVAEPQLLSDGCLYIIVQRATFSDQYYYTGELN